MATVKELFEAKVADGVIDWKKANWDSIGCPADKNAKTFLKDYPRWKQNGNGSDCAYITVNGVNVTLHGTSNQNAEEYARYQQKGNGSVRTRTSAPVVDTKNRDMAKQLLATFDNVTKEQQLMLLKLAGASEIAQKLFETFESCSTEQLAMLMSM